MKNSWIYSAAPKLALLLLAAVSPAIAAKRKVPKVEELTNFLLSPEYSQWLVGPIFRIASDDEVREFLGLTSDEQAAEFIDRFWAERGGEAVFPTRGKKLIFEERAGDADRQFSEGTYRGRGTDRGTIYILYGPPEEVRYELPVRRFGEPIEVWSYPKDSEKGLDDKKPDRLYRFSKNGDLTVFYRGPVRRQVPEGSARPPF